MDSAALEQTLAPLIANPARSAVLLDVDGTLAPITTDTHAATVPLKTREVLKRVADKYGLVACVTGRRCERALEMVGLPDITYFGNHGSEIMRAGSGKVEVAPEAAKWQARVTEFTSSAFVEFELEKFGVTSEDKGPIQGLHWRGVADEAAAETAVNKVAEQAQAAGLGIHWAKKILEVRPPVEFSKGSATKQLLGENDLDYAMFGGDDLTDLHAFTALDEAVAEGALEQAFKVGVDSEEAPRTLAPASDILLAGTEELRELLGLLVN